MIVLNDYESHLLVQFKEFYKEKNIITLCLFIHFSHLTQPLDISCFSILKWSYDKELEDFIKVYINHIIKTEFLLVFKIVYFNTMTTENIKTDFRGTSLVPYDSQTVLFKFDIKLRTSISTESTFFQINSWVSQILQNFKETVL